MTTIATHDPHTLIADAARSIAEATTALAAAQAHLSGPHLQGAARLVKSLDGIADELYALGVSL